MDDKIDNVIPFKKSLLTVQDDQELSEKEIEDIHGLVLKNLDDVLESVRNDKKITGAMVVLFNEEGRTDNYIMGSISVSRLYTVLSLYRRNLLDIYATEETD
jgi:hypothetical protein